MIKSGKNNKILILFMVFALFLASCGGGGGGSSSGGSTPKPLSDYVVFAWNDLGMHCLNPTYDEAVILPPYNNLFAQVVERGNPPQIVTSGITVEYRILNNTYSSGKTDSLGAVFAQFWQNVLAIFGTTLQTDKGLNLVDPSIHNGLSGLMTVKSDHFEADGIPVTPVEDSGTWNPYQVAEVTVKDSVGNILTQTHATVPTSDEINCKKCHGPKPFNDILSKHDAMHGTNLLGSTPVLCAGCHGSPVLGTSGPGSSGEYLSYAIHYSHSTRSAACYDCHPGATTKCSRSVAHTASDGNCTTCHGAMSDVASSIKTGSRIPWASEPTCLTAGCHSGVSGVNTSGVLYRNARGHGNMYCSSCHGSPHAMIPTTVASDNYQPIQYQGKAVTIGSCGACHDTSRGEGITEFSEVHGGTTPSVKNACHICHTAVSTDTASWPHAYTWKAR